jgi:hypothetical protein
VIGSIGQRPLSLLAIGAALGATLATPLDAGASTYGVLLARQAVKPDASLEAGFAQAKPAGAFVLVVSEPSPARLKLTWSLRCASASNRERGGATGAATVSAEHWVKRVRADWIKHPAACTGAITGSAATSPVLVRVFAQRA